jgi:hypothetical protein
MEFRFAVIAFVSALLMVGSARAGELQYAGKYSDGKLLVDLAQTSDGHDGTITLRDQVFPAVAHPDGQGLSGQFTSGASVFQFEASLDVDTLTLIAGATTYKLKRLAPPADPLDTNAASPAISADAPPGYTLVTSVGSGKSLTTEKPQIAKMNDALVATFTDLAAYFGDRPVLGTAFLAVKDSTSGNATFTATYDGAAIRGIISCKLQEGAAISVIFLRSDAPKGDWEKLMAQSALKLASPAAATAAQSTFSAVPDANIALKEYDYPDGTGSIGLADGWTTHSPSAALPCFIAGPAGQTVVLHASVNVNTPDSIAARQYQQYEQQSQNAIRTNAIYRLKPIPPILIAPFADPVTDVPLMVEQFSEGSQFNHGPTLTFEKINSSHDIPCSLPGGKGAFVSSDYTRTLDGQSTLIREESQVIVCPIAQTTWMWDVLCSVAAPDATFDRDLPTMLAIAKSEKGNAEQIQKTVQGIGNARMAAGAQTLKDAAAARQASFEDFQQSQQMRQNIHDQQQAQTQAGYDDINRAANEHEYARSRQDADQVEAIIGTRTVYDTITGESGYANLTDVNAVVDSLNQEALDPNRFVQIPLRDQLYPLPNAK